MDELPIPDVTSRMVYNTFRYAEPDGQNTWNGQFTWFAFFPAAFLRLFLMDDAGYLFYIVIVRIKLRQPDTAAPVYFHHQTITVQPGLYIPSVILERDTNQIIISDQCTYTPFWSMPWKAPNRWLFPLALQSVSVWSQEGRLEVQAHRTSLYL